MATDRKPGFTASRILGIGGYVPPKLVKNSDLEKLLDTSNEWIEQRTGIQSRHWAAENVGTSDLAVEAAKIALQNSGKKVQDIDLLVMATCTPDHDVPGCAAVVQAKLGIKPGVPFFDIRQACSGFLYGMSLADNFIKSGGFKCVLVIGAEVQSKIVEHAPRGRSVSVIFGDGAGACIMVPTIVKNPEKDSYVINTKINADGNFYKELWIESPGTALGKNRISPQDIEEGKVYPQMNGRLVFTHAVKYMPEVLLESLKDAQINIDDVDIFFFHQANMRINNKVAEDLQIPESKMHHTIQKFGNTTAATIPLGMFDAYKAGKLKSGQLVASAAFGAGFTWAAGLWRM